MPAERVLQDPAPVSLEAVELLGQFGHEDGVPALEAVLAHGHRHGLVGSMSAS